MVITERSFLCGGGGTSSSIAASYLSEKTNKQRDKRAREKLSLPFFSGASRVLYSTVSIISFSFFYGIQPVCSNLSFEFFL